ncbi:MAG: hypothetical protein IJJ26_01900, partial [Victivallales bacterium]|nr:hypothetical protein [Victivallales bacterium]
SHPTLPSPPPSNTLFLRLQDANWLAAAAPISENTVLWLLKPRPGVLQTLGTQGWALLAVTLLAGIAAAVLGWRLGVAWSRAREQLQEQERRLARAERVAVTGKLSASVIHEVRNPLAGIRMNAQLLADELHERGEDNQSLQLITREIDRIDLFLTGLSGLQSAPPDKTASTPLQPLLDELVLQMQGRCQHAGITIQTAFPPGLQNLLVHCTSGELRQVLLNLLVNACEAMPNGGNLLLAVEHSPECAILSVRDDGPGLSPDAGDVFAPFVSEKPHGSGLGLHICRQIAQRYGGSISCENVPGHGALFRLKFLLFRN